MMRGTLATNRRHVAEWGLSGVVAIDRHSLPTFSDVRSIPSFHGSEAVAMVWISELYRSLAQNIVGLADRAKFERMKPDNCLKAVGIVESGEPITERA